MQLHERELTPSMRSWYFTRRSARGHSQRFRQFPAHLSVYLYSFFPATARIWNNLPVSGIEARNIDDFKQRIVEYFCTNSAID